MTDAITAVTAAINLSKQLYSLAVVAKDAEAKHMIADLNLQLAELKLKLAELTEENNDLKQQLKRATTTTPEVVCRDGLYFKPDGDGPFCTACYDSKKQLIRVSEYEASFHEIARWHCNVCKGSYGGPH